MRSRALIDHLQGLPPRVRSWQPRTRAGRAARVGLRLTAGTAFILHGLAHAVLPARGAGAIEVTDFGRASMHVLCTLALVSFVAAGVGILGAPLFRYTLRPLTYMAVASSAIAIGSFGKPGLAWGIAVDLLCLASLPLVVPLSSATVPVRSGLDRIKAYVGAALAFGFVAYVLVVAATRPWRNRWGVRDDELTRALPGDVARRHPAFECSHAVTIAAPPEAVWPWLVQIGQDRGGFYSYAGLERVLGLGIHNADAVHPEWQLREVGDLVRAAPPYWLGGVVGRDLGWRVTLVEPNRALVLRGWGAFVLEPEGHGATRLIVRSKMGDPSYPVWGAVPSFLFLDLPHFIMQRRMLLGIRERAERAPGLGDRPSVAQGM